MSKSIDTLVPDILSLFNKGHDASINITDALGRYIASTVKLRLLDHAEERKPTLRMSNLGKPDRQLWYEINRPELRETLPAEAKIKFLYGDILEGLLLFLAKEAGHEVKDEQQEIDIDGIKGHIDAIIDGVVIDCKSASSYSFKKFEDKSISTNDPFGYIKQLGGYSTALQLPAAFLVIDKVTGKLCLCKFTQEELNEVHIADRIAACKSLLQDTRVPERCYPDEPEGKSGNRALGVGCSYCGFKKECWKESNGGNGLRAFAYSTGPKFFTNVAQEPRVFEIRI